MALFQKTVISKYLQTQNASQLIEKWDSFREHFHNSAIQENIKNSKEEQYQEGFLRDLFVNIFDYRLNPALDFNLTTEYKNVKDSKKADGAIIINEAVLAIIELKGTNTTDLAKIEEQAFGYKNNQAACKYVITSNFEKLRFYIDNAIEHIEFNLFTLTQEDFNLMYLLLACDNLKNNIGKKLKDESLNQEDIVTKKLYKDYSVFKRELFQNLTKLNPEYDPLLLFQKSQKLLDRLLFLLFGEDRGLLPPNSVREILTQWNKLQELDAYVPLYTRFKKYFGYLNTGHKGKLHDVFAYNGGLFKDDEILDNIKIDDQLLHNHSFTLSQYDFASEVDVNILGHIFENSLNEIDEIKAQLAGQQIDKATSKRKKDGVFYTPKYITKYIVENTVGKLCKEKKAALDIVDDHFATDKKTPQKIKEALLNKLDTYREWLLQLTIVDPACGSGAFLNEALNFLIKEHQYLQELEAKLRNVPIVFAYHSESILENNLFGVDLNEESVEIAKLSLWLRTAEPNRKLNSLNHNIKCGNSLIDDAAVAGDKAFNWQQEFPQVFAKGGFDVVIGNPPYGAKLDEDSINYFRNNYESVIGHSEVYYIFIDKTIKNLVRHDGLVGFIIPNAWLSNKYAKKLRQILLEENTILNLINFNRQIIFEDANVETAIIIVKKNKPNKDHQVFVGHDLKTNYKFSQNEWLGNHNSLISFAADNKIDLILKKLNSNKLKLSNVLDISNGFKPYQVGYGINLLGNPLDDKDVKNKIYHSVKIFDEYHKKEIKGKGVKRYSLTWEKSYVKWGRWLMSPKSSHYFEQPKILVRQVISDYLFAYLDKEKYYADQSLYVITNYEGHNESLEFYTLILNCKLYGFYFRKFYSEEDDLFPKIKVNELKNLPVIDISSNSQKPFIEKADLMLSLNKSLQEASAKFQGSCQRKFENINLNKKLQEWYLLSYADFIKELSKQKIKLSLSHEAEWATYFDEEKSKALALQNQITVTDAAIDQMVYTLYGLSEEEIRIVEGNAN